MLVVIPLILKLDVKVEKNSQSMIATAKKVARMIDLDVFILVEAVVGMLFGFHMNFRPVFIHSENIGTKTLMGLTKSYQSSWIEFKTRVFFFLQQVYVSRHMVLEQCWS